MRERLSEWYSIVHMGRPPRGSTFVASIRGDIAAIRTWVSKIYEIIKEHEEAIHATQEREGNKEPTGKAVRRVATFDDKTVRDAKEENDRQYRTQTAIKNATRGAVVAACIYAAIAAYQACQMRRATDAATSAATTAAKQLDVSQRPWMKMEISANGPLVIGDDGLTMHIQVVTENTGNSPAKAVYAEFKLYVGSGWPASREQELRNALCNDLKKRTATDQTLETIFPGTQPIRVSWTVSAPKADVDKSIQAGGARVVPLIIGCVVYHRTFNDAFLQTAYSSAVMSVEPHGNGLIGMAVKADQPITINADHLWISSHAYAE